MAAGRAGRSPPTAPDGSLAPSIRRFPSALHMLGEALGVERLPGARRFLGERELDPREYQRRRPCDWTSGSFMFVRQAALEDVGSFDERFFLYAEETDLCWRIKRAGWEVFHLPQMTICHFEDDRRGSAELEAQAAYARMQFARKNFPDADADYRWAIGLRYALRVGSARRRAAAAPPARGGRRCLQHRAERPSALCDRRPRSKMGRARARWKGEMMRIGIAFPGDPAGGDLVGHSVRADRRLGSAGLSRSGSDRAPGAVAAAGSNTIAALICVRGESAGAARQAQRRRPASAGMAALD